MDWNKTNLKERIFTTLIGVPLFIIILYIGSYVLLLSLALISFIAFYEAMKIYEIDTVINIATGFFLLVFIFLAIVEKNYYFAIAPLLLIPVVWLTSDSKKSLQVITTGYYVSLLMFLYLISEISFKLALAVIVTVWVFDIASYLGGAKYGKHKMNPSVSPGKSYEGFMFGLVGALISGLIMFYFKGVVASILFSLLIVFLALSGDFLESKIKRIANVKDSSKIVVGHGGVLDRFDSLLIVSPIIYLIATFTNI